MRTDQADYGQRTMLDEPRRPVQGRTRICRRQGTQRVLWLLVYTVTAESCPATAQDSLGACGAPATAIAAVQGRVGSSAWVGQTVAIEARVSADLRRSLHGVFVQAELADRDSDPETSEGLFLQWPGPVDAPRSVLGLALRARGKVTESDGLTTLAAVSDLVVCPGEPLSVAATAFDLPVASRDDWERVEGMLVRIPQRLTVTGNYELGRYGTLELSASGRQYVPTQLVPPGPPARARQMQQDRARVLLDDGSTLQDPSPIPYLDEAGTRRVGATLEGLIGVVDERFGAYRVHPIAAPRFIDRAPRLPHPPAVGGSVRVAFMNAFNYFTSLGESARCGPDGDRACRGASDERERARQRDKLAVALRALDADVIGLSEIENNAGRAVDDLASVLDSASDADASSGHAYAALPTTALGHDAITVALLYRPSRLQPVGPLAVLTNSVDPEFDTALHRPALAQTFVDLGTEQRFTLVVVHLKSKASGCDGDPDVSDGQGACNATRLAAARALVRWIASDPTHSAEAKLLLLGDLNAYANEAPISQLVLSGLTSLIDLFDGPRAYTYQYQGQSGTLDYALATPGLVPFVMGAATWHINADEPAALDYNREWKADDRFDPGQPYRASDHDPLLIGLRLGPDPRALLPGFDLRELVARTARAFRIAFARAASAP